MDQKKEEYLLLRKIWMLCVAFAAAGIFLSFVTHSKSLLFDGLYSFMQSFFILASGRILQLLGKESEEYQFGYGAFEPFLIMLRTGTILLCNGLLFVSSAKALVSGGYKINAAFAVAYEIVSVFACSAVYLLLKGKAHRLKSPLLRTEANSWLNDTCISIGVLLAFASILFLPHTRFAFLASYMDGVTVIICISFLTPSLVRQLRSSIHELLDGAPPENIRRSLSTMMEKEAEMRNFVGYHLFSAKRGRSLYVTVYFNLRENRPLFELDAIRNRIIGNLRKTYRWIDADIVFEVIQKHQGKKPSLILPMKAENKA